jgi:hypothetical protein
LIYLQKAALLHLLASSQITMGAMQKPEKVFLDNSYLLYTLVANANTGNVRETFFGNTDKILLCCGKKFGTKFYLIKKDYFFLVKIVGNQHNI